MIYYHLSADLSKDGHFIPRAPMDICLFEDNMTERVCVSTTIEGCLSSMPGGFMKEKTKDFSCVMKLFKIDTNKLNIQDTDILVPEELLENHLVPDSLLTKEHWILKEFIVPSEDISLIKINSILYDVVSLFSAGTSEEIKELYSSSETIELVRDISYSSTKQISTVHDFYSPHKEALDILLDIGCSMMESSNCTRRGNTLSVDFSNCPENIEKFYLIFDSLNLELAAA